jgi:membrane fusion protein, copper/silver efflux system
MKFTKREILIAVISLFAGVIIFALIRKSAHQQNGSSEQIEQTDQQQVWTCSMHPQIRQDEPGKCPLCGMALIPVPKSGQSGQRDLFIHTMSPEAVALANIQTTKISFVTPEHEIYLTGKIAVNEQKTAVITADYSGRIEKLHVDFTGQMVNKEQKLASIYSPELVTAQKELLEASKYKESNPLLYNAAREKLRLWKITEKQINLIEKSRELLTEFDVYADISGIVLRRDVSKGDYVSRGNVLFEIADLNHVWILLDAYETDLPFLKVGQKISFTLASVPGKEYSSVITFIDPLINPQTRTLAVRAETPNPEMALKPEMFVRAKIKTSLSIKEKSLLIPKTSVLWTGKRSVVYIKVPEADFPSFEMREIDLGVPSGDFYVVESGLKEGEEIVTNGVFAIDAAAQLNGNYSMMNRPVDIRVEVPVKFREQITNLTKAYFEVKNSLIDSDFPKAQTSAKQMQQQLSKVDMKLLSGKAHDTWMPKHNELSSHLSAFVKAKDLEGQRMHFEPVSNAIIDMAETFGLTIDKVYKAYCPMALDDEGAHWLSEFEAIKNPYFGDAMLRCGEVKDVIERDRPVYKKDAPPAKPQEEHRH